MYAPGECEWLMARRDCAMVVRHGSREEDRRRLVVDTADVPAMEEHLADWLSAKGWARSRWREFEAEFSWDGGRCTVRGVA